MFLVSGPILRGTFECSSISQSTRHPVSSHVLDGQPTILEMQGLGKLRVWLHRSHCRTAALPRDRVQHYIIREGSVVSDTKPFRGDVHSGGE